MLNDVTHFQFSYSPWGVRTHIDDETHFYQPGEEPGYGPFYRTYTGHEDLWMFGLLNANARLYSPYLGRFVSPDPLLNCEGGAWDYNPYVYANNNPYKYIDRNGEFCGLVACLLDFAFNALFNAAVEATVYSVTAAISGNWNAGDFFKSLGMGAVSSALQVGGIGIGTGNNFAMNIMSNMVNNTVTNAIFGESMSLGDIPGMIIGASIGAKLPYYSPSGTNVFKNVMSEVGINTFRGAVTGFSSGVVNAIVHDDPSLALKGAVGGALSGCVRTAAHNAVFGAGYQPLDENGNPVSYGTDGVNRRGGLASLFGGTGIALGRYAYLNEKSTKKEELELYRFHENAHLLQEKEKGGYIRFYRRTMNQYLTIGRHKCYVTPGTLEWKADDYVESNTGYPMHRVRQWYYDENYSNK